MRAQPSAPCCSNTCRSSWYTAHSAIANARARIDQRLARWLLMAHDRIGDNTLPLTRQFLALILGVRRAGVTESLQSLKRQKLIHTGRNEITVLNRKGRK